MGPSDFRFPSALRSDRLVALRRTRPIAERSRVSQVAVPSSCSCRSHPPRRRSRGPPVLWPRVCCLHRREKRLGLREYPFRDWSRAARPHMCLRIATPLLVVSQGSLPAARARLAGRVSHPAGRLHRVSVLHPVPPLGSTFPGHTPRGHGHTATSIRNVDAELHRSMQARYCDPSYHPSEGSADRARMEAGNRARCGRGRRGTELALERSSFETIRR
jgi:hypothetical protein